MKQRVPIKQPSLAAQIPMGQHLPFDIPFQGLLLKLLLQDRQFGTAMTTYIAPQYFQNPTHQWAWARALEYRRDYGALPTVAYLVSLAHQQDHAVRDIHVATLCLVRDGTLTDEDALRAQTLEFIRRCVFKSSILDTKDLFNAGKVDEAYDEMQRRMEILRTVSVHAPRRSWLEDYAERQVARQDPTTQASAVATCIPAIDKVLEGGLRPGELGLWLAYAKAGKSTFLVNLGITAVRTQGKRVLHCVLEGNLSYIANRYDSILTDELYSNVKAGDIDSVKYARAFAEAQSLRGKSVIRDFTDAGWEVNAVHIDDELRDLKRTHGFVPDLIVLDYVDLMRSRTKQDTETAEQKQAVQDLKMLANRGYPIWSASQVQRPKDESFADSPHLLTSRSIADCYAKVRIADFVGSINQTTAERQQNVLRLYAELYRDGAAGIDATIHADFSRMVFSALPGQGMPGAPTPGAGNGGTVVQKALGYGSLKQAKGT